MIHRISIRITSSFILFLLFLCGCHFPPEKFPDIIYELKEPQEVTVELCGNDGTFISVICAGKYAVGKHQVFWNGTDEKGNMLPAGKYILKIKTNRIAVKDEKFGKNSFIEFTNPCDVEMDSNGNIYILDRQPQNKLCGIYKFDANGFPKTYGTSSENFLNLENGSTTWFELDCKGNIFYNFQNQIMAVNPTGGFLYAVQDKKIKASTVAGLIHNKNLYLRTRINNDVSSFDLKNPPNCEYRFSSQVLMPPIVYLYVGPSMAAGAGNYFYLTDARSCGNYMGALVKYEDTGKSLEKLYQYRKPFKDSIGLAADPQRNMVYVTERGTCSTANVKYWKLAGRNGITSSRIYQIWDSGDDFKLVSIFEDKTIQGLRDVTVSPDGKLLYVLEDSDNFGDEKSPSLNLKGKGRLFKYNLSYTSVSEKIIYLKGTGNEKK